MVESVKKKILHLCADIGSDSYYYQIDDTYDVVMIGKDIGVENFSPDINIHGVIANPVCTDLSTAPGFHKDNDMEKGMFLVNHCLRIIGECKPKWWVLENPFNGRLKDVLGRPNATYQPWQFGSPWTKKTALWGDFAMPTPLFKKYDHVPKIERLYLRPGRAKVGMYQLHKSAISLIPEFYKFRNKIVNDADLRSLCSQGFAKAFKDANE